MFDTIPDMAAKRAEISPDAIAFTDAGSGRQWRFAEINDAANAVAAGLDRAGFAPGDRLAILCLNRVEFFITLFACQKTGVILCPLNWRQPAPELVETLEPVGAKALIHDAAQAGLAQVVATTCGISQLVSAVYLRHDRPAEGGDPDGPDGLGQRRQHFPGRADDRGRPLGQFPAAVSHCRHQSLHTAAVSDGRLIDGSAEIRAGADIRSA
jgi:fatty-acyl-CoA synthase